MEKMKKKELIKKIFSEVLGASSVDTKIIEKYISFDYIQNVDGNTLDYDGFINHMKKQKEVIKSLDVDFLAIAQDGENVFTNHIVTAVKKDESIVKVKVIAQFVIKNNLLVKCDELTQMLSGKDEDKDIGSRH
ncbi:hypothetical protein [Malaciobacter canalis]|uniref:hypothetical protein n=1 Tax=Malaciobacter canalis TaxID=1912871 RepID=UPI00384E3207